MNEIDSLGKTILLLFASHHSAFFYNFSVVRFPARLTVFKANGVVQVVQTGLLQTLD